MRPEAVQSVAYLGPRGTFSEAAARAWLDDADDDRRGDNTDRNTDNNANSNTGGNASNNASDNIGNKNNKDRECLTIDDVFTAVEQGATRYGVVPVENSTEGAVNNTLDCFVDTPLQIVGERIIKIEHHLFTQAGLTLKDIRRIASHKQSLAQCRQWLRANCPQLPLHECTSNAEAARLSAEDAGTAAIAGALAGEIYGLHPLANRIQDQAHNSTRFLVLAKDGVAATGHDKTSVLIYAENRPGSLFRLLEPFENLQISLTRIETRPTRKEAWAYVFFIDFEGHKDDDNVRELFSRLSRCTAEVKTLGSYPRCELK